MRTKHGGDARCVPSFFAEVCGGRFPGLETAFDKAFSFCYSGYMDKHYDEQYLEFTVVGLLDGLRDLDTWSAYNDDEYNEEVDELRKIVDRIAKKAGMVSLSKRKEIK